MPNILFPPYVRTKLALYFKDADPANYKQNILQAKPLVKRWGIVTLNGGFLMVVESFSSFQNNDWQDLLMRSLLVDQIMYYANRTIPAMHDLVQADGSAATGHLGIIIRDTKSEDVRALAAYIMCSGKFARRSAIVNLERVYSKTVGTACRIAMALALSQCGEGKYIKQLIQDGVIGTGDITYYDNLIKHLVQQFPGRSRAEIERIIAVQFAAPELVQENTTRSLCGMIAMDIASDGIAMRPIKPGTPPWVRKH
jgi:hypothetical protein